MMRVHRADSPSKSHGEHSIPVKPDSLEARLHQQFSIEEPGVLKTADILAAGFLLLHVSI